MRCGRASRDQKPVTDGLFTGVVDPAKM